MKKATEAVAFFVELTSFIGSYNIEVFTPKTAI